MPMPAFRLLFITVEVSWFSLSFVRSARSTSMGCLASYKESQLTTKYQPSNVAPCWATLHLSELYAAPYLVMLHSWAMLHTAEFYAALYPATYWHSQHPFLSFVALSQLHCTLWATMHPTELSCILMSYTTPYWATLHPLLSYTAPCWATPPPHTLQLAELCCTLLNNASPSEQCCTELCFTLLSYALATQLWWTLLSYSAPPMV